MNSCIVTFYYFSVKVYFQSQLCLDNKQLFFFFMKLHSLEDKPIATGVGIKVGIKAGDGRTFNIHVML